MASGLNSRNAVVNVLDDEHYKAKVERFKFTKYIFYSGIANVVIGTALFVLLGSVIRAGVHFLAMIGIIYYIISDTVKKLDLRHISGIIFDNAEYTTFANNEIVFEAIRSIGEMRGFMRGRISMFNLIHLITALSLIIETLNYVLGGILPW